MIPTPFHTTVRQGDLLGPGRLGTTWAAEGPHGEPLVVKRLAGLASAEAEAKETAARLAVLPGCVAPVGVEARDGDLWILYPFIHGTGPVEAAATIGPSLGADLEQAVARVHAAGLAHGALHNSNVRITATGEVLLLDTGLAGLGAVDAVGAATAHTDRRDLAALLERMAARPDEGGKRRRAGPAALVLTVVVILASVEMTRAGRGGAAVAATRLPRHAGPAHPLPSASRCAAGSLPGTGGATYWAVDMTGSGCAQPMAWAAGVISTVSADGTPMHFSLGGPGDVLLVGHWFCSRAELPALYRPATGQVFYIPAWPAHGGVVNSAPAVETGIRGGTAQSSVRGGCARVEVVR